VAPDGRHSSVASCTACDRPALAAALRDSEPLGATLVIAKLDRLSRNAAAGWRGGPKIDVNATPTLLRNVYRPPGAA
jgi:hypothetical protein